MLCYLVWTVQVQEQTLLRFFPNFQKKTQLSGRENPLLASVFTIKKTFDFFLLIEHFDKIIVRYLFCQTIFVSQVYSDKDQIESMLLNKEFNLIRFLKN